jgi:toxin ParE1/3/4
MTLIWSRRAVQQLADLRDFISQDSEQSASDVATSILATVELLKSHPDIGRPGRILGTRELVIPGTPYIVPYRVRQGRLELIAVFHGRQQWPARL